MLPDDYLIKAVKQKVRSIDPDARVFLFGSRARKDHRKDSDWDFFILTRKKADRRLKNKVSDLLLEVELDTSQVITCILENIDTWNEYTAFPFKDNVTKEALEI